MTTRRSFMAKIIGAVGAITICLVPKRKDEKVERESTQNPKSCFTFHNYGPTPEDAPEHWP